MVFSIKIISGRTIARYVSRSRAALIFGLAAPRRATFPH